MVHAFPEPWVYADEPCGANPRGRDCRGRCGVVALWISRALRLPAIIPLLLLGTVLGPQLLGLLPRPSSVMPGTFSALVEVGVVIILFDGGLSLLAAGKATVRSHQLPLSPNSAKRGKVFLPLACIDGHGIRPYSLDEPRQAEEIPGLEFGTPDPLPFVPYWGSREKVDPDGS